MTDRETTFTAYADEKYWTFYSCEKSMMNRISRLSEQFPEQFKITSQKNDSITALISKSVIKIGKPRKEMTAEQKQRAAANLAKAHKQTRKEG